MLETSQTHTSNINEVLSHWAKMGRWSLHEVIVLSLGEDPKIITMERIREIKNIDKYLEHEEVILRAITGHKLNYSYSRYEKEYYFDPLDFVRWAKQFDIDMPEQLAEKVFLYHQEGDFKGFYEQEIANSNELKKNIEKLREENIKLKQEKSSMQQKINTAQAYFSCVVDDKFSNEKSRITNVLSALERQGIPASKNTISKHYKEGKTARLSKDNLKLENE